MVSYSFFQTKNWILPALLIFGLFSGDTRSVPFISFNVIKFSGEVEYEWSKKSFNFSVDPDRSRSLWLHVVSSC